MSRIIALIFGILLTTLIPHIIYASTIGESLELGFYSRIHAGIDDTIDTLRKKELSKFPTFAGFGTCRPPLAWLDREPMNELILTDLRDGNLSRLSAIMNKNKILGTSDSDSFSNLVTCLVETYNNMGDIASKDENALSSAGILGIYTDGDTENSDYDIVADIEKINAILFTEKLDYIGRLNTSKDSYRALAEGVPIPSVTGDSDSDTAGGISGDDTSTISTTPTLASLGLGDQCTPEQETSSVANITDAAFLSELDSVIAGGTPPLAGASYGPVAAISTLQLDNEDFFHTLPCTSSFCIRIKTVPGEIRLMGGSSYSIESLVDKHSAIMTPIANSNLQSQKHTKESYQLTSIGTIFKNLIPQVLYMEQRPEKKKQVAAEYTQEMQDAEFEEMRRCAYVSAGLPSDMRRANILGGAGYQLWTNTNTENIENTEKSLSVINPEDAVIATCMDIAGARSRGKYYESFSTDLTELEGFTAALVDMLASATEEHKALDKKKSY